MNLALAVGPPRAGDGYHPIASWMHPIDLCDDLLVTRLEDDRLSRYAILWHDNAPRKSPIDWSITKDLAVRAHQALEAEAGRPLPVQLKLDKRIPVGGGLGGGSSDAAAMLLAVRELFELPVSDERLAQIALKLGSDVAFFLAPGPALVEGVGERLERLAPAAGDLLLLLPLFGCPTGDVYRAFDAGLSRDHRLRDDEVRRLMAQLSPADAELFNDLALSAERVAPELGELRRRVSEAIAGRPVHVTGSGSTLFILLAGDPDAAHTEAVVHAAAGPEVVVVRSHLT